MWLRCNEGNREVLRMGKYRLWWLLFGTHWRVFILGDLSRRGCGATISPAARA
jgi:hypothetical protein